MKIEELYEKYAEELSDRALNDGSLDETISRYARENSRPSKGVASRFMAAFRRYLCEGKDKPMFIGAGGVCLYLWNGMYFQRIDNHRLFLKELFRRVLAKMEVSPVLQEFTSGMIANALMETMTATDAFVFTPNRRYICFNNGVLDLRGNGGMVEWKSHSIARVTDLVLDFDRVDAKTARVHSAVGKENALKYDMWQDRLNEIIPSPAVQRCFQEVCGSMIADRREFKSEYFAILVGHGSNGKSVVVNAIANVFGSQYVSRYTLQQLFSNQRSDRYIADLSGKVVNICDDLNENSVRSGDLKRFVSGEEIQAMRAYATDPIKVAAPPLIGCCNTIPRTNDDTYGYLRRILVLPTTPKRFGEELPKDPNLTAKLSETPCRQAIMNWIVEGYKRYVRNGGVIELPPEVKAATMEVMDEATPGRMWLRDRGYVKKKDVTEQGGRWLTLQELYADYCDFCRSLGVSEKERGDAKKLSQLLRNEDYEQRRFRVGSTCFRMEKYSDIVD